VSAPYPIGAGIGPETIEEGRLVAAMGRLASATLVFDVDEHGMPVHFQIPYSSADVWGNEASAMVGGWRFAPGTKYGIPVSIPCTVRLVWGERELDPATVTQMRREMDEQAAASPDVFPRPALTNGTLWVDPQAQAAKLVVKTSPEYPSFARAAGFRGTVRFHVLIGVDGRLRQAEMMSGHPALMDAAVEAVKQWVYQPTLLNGTQVEVTTEVDVDVGPPQ
jgi:TonB family protein